MSEKPEWRQMPGWWDGIPFWVVFDPNQVIRMDPALWPDPYTSVDDEELEMLELAGRLAILKTTKKH